MKNLFKAIKEDFGRYSGPNKISNLKILLNYGFIGITIFRINKAFYYTFRKIPLIGLFVAFVNFLVIKFCQIFFGFSIPEKVKLGNGIYISHLGTIIINSDVVIGEYCNLGPMIVIGWGKSKGVEGVPHIGNRVWIGPGAKIFGPIKIGNNVAIGANAVVNFDVPDNATVVGNPAKVIYDKGSFEYINAR